MISRSSRSTLADYGFARVRDSAFDAVSALWRIRQSEGVTQKDIADKIGRDAGWVSRQLKGPGNWTFRTFGALVEALDGEAEISVEPLEAPLPLPRNFDAYSAPEDFNLRELSSRTSHQSAGFGQLMGPAA